MRTAVDSLSTREREWLKPVIEKTLGQLKTLAAVKLAAKKLKMAMSNQESLSSSSSIIDDENEGHQDDDDDDALADDNDYRDDEGDGDDDDALANAEIEENEGDDDSKADNDEEESDSSHDDGKQTEAETKHIDNYIQPYPLTNDDDFISLATQHHKDRQSSPREEGNIGIKRAREDGEGEGEGEVEGEGASPSVKRPRTASQGQQKRPTSNHGSKVEELDKWTIADLSNAKPEDITYAVITGHLEKQEGGEVPMAKGLKRPRGVLDRAAAKLVYLFNATGPR